MYRRNLAILIGGLIALAAVTGFLTWAYDYGRPIGQTIVATTITGEQIVNPPGIEVHLAYTQPYAFANQWHLFANASGLAAVFGSSLLHFIGELAGGMVAAYKLIQYIVWRMKRMKPSDRFYPYGFWSFKLW